ncbi:MAG: serine hydrolase [Pseudomonadota bacterium]
MIRPLARPFTILCLTSTALAGCAATAQEAAAPEVAPSVANAPAAAPDKGSANLASNSLYSDLDNPTTPADLPQTASVLELERYRPTYKLTACQTPPAVRAIALGELAQAVAAAQSYSDEQRGLGLIIMLDGEILHQSYAEGVSGATPSASASMMKSVIALLYGIAIEDGVIGSIDDPVGDYLAEWKDDARGTITLRQLMTMSAGLGQSDFLKILLAPDIGAVALELEKTGEPDAEFAYNNAITKVLTLVLDRKLAEAGKGGVLPYLQSELWCPLGNGVAQVWVDASGKARGYAGLHAGLADYARIGEMIRKGGRAGGKQIVPEAWIAEMAKPSKANAQYGLQVWLGGEWNEKRSYSAANPIKIPHKEAFVAKDIVYFDGFGGQRVYIIPSKRLVIARFGEVNLAYDDSVIPNLLVSALN